jgi:hypothetical protein
LLRIGLLLDSTVLQAWQLETIRQVIASGIAEINFLVINQSPKSSGKSSPFLYRVYRKLDRLLFKTRLDAFESVSIFSVFSSDVPKLMVTPNQKRYRDYFSEKDLEQILGFNPDILIRFGFRILSGPILNLPRLGVWSFHHGDPGYYRGGPPAFWEVMNKQPITSYVLMQLTEDLDQGKILYQSWTQTDPLSVQRNANRLFWASAQASHRVLKEIERIGWENWNEKISKSPLPEKSPLWKPPGPLRMLRLWISLVTRSMRRKWDEFQNRAHWQIGNVSETGTDSILSLDPTDLQLLEHPKPERFFLADPFSIYFKGKDYLFAEEFDKKKNRGRIVWISNAASGIQTHPVIEEAWHLSYPFLWEEKNQVLMIPESSEAGEIYVYKGVDFPLNWENQGVFFDQEGYDPTVVKKDGVYWLFINQKAHPACLPFDELNLYWTDNLENPQWHAHPQNPIVSDVRESRPAGRLFEKENVWYRPAQDSGIRYGHQIKLQKVIKWSKSEYEEETFQVIQASDPALGIHTWNRTESGTWVDFYFRK